MNTNIVQFKFLLGVVSNAGFKAMFLAFKELPVKEAKESLVPLKEES